MSKHKLLHNSTIATSHNIHSHQQPSIDRTPIHNIV